MSTAAVIGIFDHWGWGIAMTATADGQVLDRRRIELVAAGEPRYPYHHDAQGLPLPDAEQMIASLERSVCRHAGLAFDSLAASIQTPVSGIALRACPRIRDTVQERLDDYFSRNNADSVLYRQALAEVAQARGWQVHWYDARTVVGNMCEALQLGAADQWFADLRQTLGSPWTQDHRLALAAAIAAGR